MNELALFAGAGGGILGSVLLGHRVVCAVEINPYCREVLMARQEDGSLPPFPIWDDVRTFDGRPWRGIVDVVSAGFPCQPFSVAGRKRGADDNRNMWPDTIRVIREVGPRIALLENVPHILAHDYFGQVLGDLAAAGFDAEWGIVSAGECGAWQLRERLWIMAYPYSLGESLPDEQVSREEKKGETLAEHDGANGVLADTHCVGRIEEWSGREVWERLAEASWGSWWATEPDVGRVVHGLPHRVERIAALGNAQVPRVACEAWRRLEARGIAQ